MDCMGTPDLLAPGVLADYAGRDFATPQERERLRKLIGYVLHADTPAERDETLVVACADPTNAILSFRNLALQRKERETC